jgi:serine/threonine-protein kinase
MPEGKENLLFGTIAVQLGYTTPERVEECSKIQQKIKEFGISSKKLGEIMVDKGYLTEGQVKHIFRVQGLKGGHTQIAGYKIISLTGEGAMGKIYKALQVSMDRLVAIKVLAPQLAQNEKFVARFFQEARAVAKLNHPNIIQGIDVGESDGIHYFAMEYIEGSNLGELVTRNGPFEEKQSIDIIIQVAKALDHAHKHNLIHRDIKPSNIMITKDNVVKLCDLGLALLITKASDTVGKKFLTGTPAYLSPEQAHGAPDIDIRSDIYSLGATFYYILLGVPPFTGTSVMEVVDKQLTQAPIPPKQKKPSISDLTNSIILTMLAKNRVERFQTPEKLIIQLELSQQYLTNSLQGLNRFISTKLSKRPILSRLARLHYSKPSAALRSLGNKRSKRLILSRLARLRSSRSSAALRSLRNKRRFK